MSTIHSFKLYNQFTLSETEKDQADVADDDVISIVGDDHPIIFAENEVLKTVDAIDGLPGGDVGLGDISAKHHIPVFDETVTSAVDKIVTLESAEISNAGGTVSGAGDLVFFPFFIFPRN